MIKFVIQSLCQLVTDIAATNDQDFLHGLGQNAKPLQNIFLIPNIAYKINDITFPDHIKTTGDNQLVITNQRSNDYPQFIPNLVTKMYKLSSYNRAFFRKTDPDQPDLAIGKLVDLHGPRHAHKPEYRIYNFLVGIDNFGYPYTFSCQQMLVIGIDTTPNTSKLGNIATEHVCEEA